MNSREVLSKVDSIFISVVFEVVPQAMIESDGIRSHFVRWCKYEEIISLFIPWVTGRDTSDLRISCLSQIWFKVGYFVFV